MHVWADNFGCLEGYWSSGINKEWSYFSDSLTTLDFLFSFFFVLLFWIFPFSPSSFLKWGKQGTAAGPAMCGGNGPRLDGSGNSDQAGVENGDQGHGLGLWVYHWVYGTGHKALGLDIGH